MRWPGYPRYRDASALFSVVYQGAVLFAMRAMRIETMRIETMRIETMRIETMRIETRPAALTPMSLRG
jgi:hypothetical protein